MPRDLEPLPHLTFDDTRIQLFPFPIEPFFPAYDFKTFPKDLLFLSNICQIIHPG